MPELSLFPGFPPGLGVSFLVPRGCCSVWVEPVGRSWLPWAKGICSFAPEPVQAWLVRALDLPHGEGFILPALYADLQGLSRF